jgi:hypothetical protein
MRLLVIGGFSAFDSLGTVVRALQRRADLEVSYLPIRAMLETQTPDAVGEAVVQAALKSDALLAWQVKGDLPVWVPDRLARRCARIWWTIDDPYLLLTERSAWRDQADMVLTCSDEAVRYSLARGQRAELVWPAADPEVHGMAQPGGGWDPTLLADFAFCATNGYERTLYPRVRAERREIARALRPLGKLDLWGRWNDSDLAPLCRGWKKYEDLGAVFASASVNLNNHILPDAPGYLNQRVFEICGSGGFQLCDDCAGLRGAGFESGVHLVTWHNLEDLVPKARYYLEHEDERRRIAAAGREHALREHGADRWAGRFVAMLEGLVR